MSTEEARVRRARILRRVFVWSRRVLLTLLILAGLSMVALALFVRHFEDGLPPTNELKRYNPPQVTRIIARDGTLLGEDFVERRTVVDFRDIPSQVKLAFLAAEDASFYEHEGLDYPGMIRAIWVNLRSHTSRQGASTITQQVVKNVLLTQDRTYERKIKEVILSRRIEQELSKDEILELYLNHIYFGHGRYGVEEASRYYFGKGVKDLTLGEAALLAGVPKGPSRYSPREHMDLAMGRREYVLAQMVDKGFVSADIAEEARHEQVKLAPEPEHTAEVAPEVLAEVRRQLREIVGDDATHGGYVVETTIDPKLQLEARKALREGLDAFDKRQKLLAPFKKPKKMPALFEGDPLGKDVKQRIFVGEVTGADDAKGELYVRAGTLKGKIDVAGLERYNPQKLSASKFAEVGAPLRVSILASGNEKTPATFRLEAGPQSAIVAINVRTREILAMAGSYEGLRGGLDRATQSFRQPGSSFKPFTYAKALASRKFTPATLLPTDGSALEGYRPKNYDRSAPGAPTRMRDAFARSINVSAAWLVGQVGPKAVADLATDLGIHSKLGETPSIALGAYEVSPRELTGAYASIAAGGVYEEPYLISKITGPDGRDIPIPSRTEPHRVLDDTEAYMITSLMKTVVDEGTGKGAKVLKRPIAGKTGTSNEGRDAWFVGFSTEIACGVWVGHDDRQPLGAGEAGGTTAMPAFVAFMKVAHDGIPATDFPVPPGIERREIDAKTGLLAAPDQDSGTLSEIFLAGTAPTQDASTVNVAPLEPPQPSATAPKQGDLPPTIVGDPARPPSTDPTQL
ncbi:MAG: PBP1A family penicillin-binding protein [Polyangiaceae bacterium]